MEHVYPGAPEWDASIETTGVMIGLPCYGGQLYESTFLALREAEAECRALGIPFHIVTIRNESLIQRARNTIASIFLHSKCDRLVFVDADIGFKGKAFVRLLKHDRDVVGGVYCKKSLASHDFAVTYAAKDNTARRDPVTGAIECRHLATGFLAIKRNVLERMIEAFPHMRYRSWQWDGSPEKPQYHYNLFDCWIDPARLELLSEDYAFCERWRAMGGEVWADPYIKLQHHGTACFEGEPMAGLTIA
jgi:hypothetical protein